ncbi:MAG: NAD-dependent epimerase/dehydratase family protein [Planctomycetota bacterium]
MKCVVTGGGGFVGSAICRSLIRSGHDVLAVGRNEYPALVAEGVTTAKHDLAASPETLIALCRGAAVVFHTAAHVAMWGRREEFVRGNITATRNVIAACRAAGVPVLIFTSSPAVIADGNDLRGVDESHAYSQHYVAHYPATKAAAEREVRQSHGSGLTTVALRPHLIFGPGDTHLVPTIVSRARAGRLVRVGDGCNRVDLTFIDDCVAAHLAAWQAAQTRATLVGGRAFFISQGDPTPLWPWIDRVLALHGLPPVQRSLPVWLAHGVATALEALWTAGGIRSEPMLTKFLVSEMATEHFFDIRAARKDLGYQPMYSVQEATQRSFGRSSANVPREQ